MARPSTFPIPSEARTGDSQKSDGMPRCSRVDCGDGNWSSAVSVKKNEVLVPLTGSDGSTQV
jgi:hypothetical protein